jgi:hypothetical protein
LALSRGGRPAGDGTAKTVKTHAEPPFGVTIRCGLARVKPALIQADVSF